MGNEENRQEREEDDGRSDIECNRNSKFSQPKTISDWLSKKAKKDLGSAGAFDSKRNGFSGIKTQLSKVSKKQKIRNKDYKNARESHYSKEENQKCFLCGSANNLSIHHIKKRGSNISDQSAFVTLCLMGNYMDLKYKESNHTGTGGCHGWVESNKSLSREIGLIE